MRYARQQAVLGPGGQARLRQGAVVVAGDELAALVCARYLIGAGVATVSVSTTLLEDCQGLNQEVRLLAHHAPGALRLSVNGQAHEPTATDPVARGAEAARWALMQLLRGPA